MSELLVKFDESIIADGARYHASVWGEEDDIGRWLGWLEFAPDDGGPPVRTERETVQPNRTDLEYWATGLTRVYLDGALVRARSRRFDDSRPRREGRTSGASDAEPRWRPVLDPFATFAQGEGILRAELGALSVDRLRSIAAAFAIASPETSATLGPRELEEEIVTAARRRLSRPDHGNLTPRAAP